MAGPISVIPQGLLGLLQIKSQGRNPSNLVDGVQGQIDLFPMWVKRQEVDLLAGVATSRNNSTGTSGVFAFTPNAIIVPQGFTWFVTKYSVDASLAAADTIRFAPALLTPAPGENFTLGIDVADVVTARARVVFASAFNFWLGPGEQLGVAIFDVLAGTNVTTFAQVRGISVPI